MEKKSAGRINRGKESQKFNMVNLNAGDIDINYIRRENSFLRTILDEFPFGVFVKSVKSGKYIYWNGKCEELTNLRSNEIIGKTDKQIFGKDKAAAIKEQDDKTVRTGRRHEYSGDIYINDADTDIKLRIIKIPLKIKGREPDFLAGIIEDVTSEYLVKEKLTEKEKYLQKIFQTVPDIIYIYDTVTNKNIFISGNITGILGYSKKDTKNIRGNLSARFIRSCDIKKYNKDVILKIPELSENKILITPVRLRTKNRKEDKWMIEHLTVLEKSNAGKPLKVMGVLTDITELKNAGNELKKCCGKLESAEHIVDMGHWEYDLNNKKSDWTDGINRIFGTETKGKIKKIEDFKNFIPQEDRKNLKKLADDLLKGNSKEISHRIKLPSGKEKYLLTRIKPVFDDSGKVIKVSGTSADVTGKMESEIKLRKLSDELLKYNNDRDRFFSIIAHDFRGPFTGLLGYTSVLDNEFSILSRSDIHNYIKIINASLKTVYNLIENLLQWSKIQRGKLLFNPEKIDLFTVSESVISSFKSESGSKNINVVNDIKQGSIVFADDNMMRSVFQNLFSNSIKYSNEGGSIIFSAEEKNNYYEISVSDTGIGMKPEFVKNLFKIELPYTTLGTGNEKGSGLGLMLCKEFINRHNSKLHVNSEEGIGTTFYFKIKKSG